jgi:hypothetical protein
MADVIGRFLTDDHLREIAPLVGQPVPTHCKDVRDRHRILTATEAGNSTGDLLQQSAWSMYVDAAIKCGLLPETELESRLHGTNDDNFRSAISECMAAWYLGGLGFEVKPRPEATTSRNVDFLLNKSGLDLYTEVKAPCPPAGDGAPSLRKSISDAGADQFKRGRVNLLVICPALDFPVCRERKQLIEATIGQLLYEVPVSLDGSPPPKGGVAFHQTGKLAKWNKNKQTGAFTTDFTRISAVMTLESQHALDVETGAEEIDHRALVAHNPFATHPISPELFGDLPQWVINRETQTMGWNDGYDGV